MRAPCTSPSSFGTNVAARLRCARSGQSLRVDGKDVTFERCSETTLSARDANGDLILFNLDRLYSVTIPESDHA